MCASKHQNKTQEKESKAKRSTSWLHLWTCMRLVLILLLSHFILLLRNASDTIQLLNVLYSKNPTAQLFLGQILIDWQVWQWGFTWNEKSTKPTPIKDQVTEYAKTVATVDTFIVWNPLHLSTDPLDGLSVASCSRPTDYNSMPGNRTDWPLYSTNISKMLQFSVHKTDISEIELNNTKSICIQMELLPIERRSRAVSWHVEKISRMCLYSSKVKSHTQWNEPVDHHTGHALVSLVPGTDRECGV